MNISRIGVFSQCTLLKRQAGKNKEGREREIDREWIKIKLLRICATQNKDTHTHTE